MPDSDHQESPLRTVTRVIFKTSFLFVVYVASTIVDNLLRWMKIRKKPVEESPLNLVKESELTTTQQPPVDNVTPKLGKSIGKRSDQPARTEKS